MNDTMLCKKSAQTIPKSALQCPFPSSACKYRAECLIYAFEQVEKMDQKGQEKPKRIRPNQAIGLTGRKNEDIS